MTSWLRVFARGLILLTGADLLVMTTITAGEQPRQQVAERSPGSWVLVTAPGLREALQPLIEHRRAEGFRVTIIETTNLVTQDQMRSGGEALKERVREAFRDAAPPLDLLLAGAPPTASLPAEYCLPMLAGDTARMKGKPTDFGYAFADEAGRPKVAVGRFPARNPAELDAMVRKTLRLETSPPPGGWRSSLLLIQGNPGGGGMAEMFVDGLTKPRLARLDPAWQLAAISHNACSSYYSPTAMLRPLSLEYLERGALFSVYLGHSGRGAFWSNGTNFMTSADWVKLDMKGRQGVFFTCGCFGCELDRGSNQAYGLAAIRNPNGPTAVIGALGESYSAPGLLAVDGLLGCLAKPPFPTRLADYWLAVQRSLVEGKIDPGTFGLLDLADGTQGKVPLPVQRLEHVQMWILLGDPALRVPVLPSTISMEPIARASLEESVSVSGTLPEELKGATVCLDVESSSGAPASGLERMPAESPDRERLATENHRRANHRVLATAKATANERAFRCSLGLPLNLGFTNLVIRAYAETGNDCAQGILQMAIPGAAK